MTITSQIPQMAYVGAVPFHGSGTNIAGLHWHAGWEKAGLSYTVSKRPLVTCGPDGFIDVPDMFATVRDDNDAVMGIVGKKYDVLQPLESRDYLGQIAEAGGGDVEWETLGTFDGGRKIWGLLRLDGLEFEAKAGDTVKRYLFYVGSFDGSCSNRFGDVSTRVVCSNTYAHAMREMANSTWIKAAHTASQRDKIQAGIDALTRAKVTAQDDALVAQAMARKSITKQGWEDVKDALFPIPVAKDGKQPRTGKMDAIRARLDECFVQEVDALGSATAWAAFNAVTGWANHLASAKDSGKRFQSLMMGAQGKRQAQAYTMLSAMAESATPIRVSVSSQWS